MKGIATSPVATPRSLRRAAMAFLWLAATSPGSTADDDPRGPSLRPDVPYHDYVRRAYDVRDGLPSGWIEDLLQTRDGYLWVALWGGGKVIRIDPDTGSVVFEVLVPADQVTCAAFGGESLDQLYITTANYQRSAEDEERQPLAGSLFRAQVPFRGVAVPAFLG